MKNRKIILMTIVLSLFLVDNTILGQSKSKEELGNALVKSILSKDVESFKALLLPQKVVYEVNEDKATENLDRNVRDSLMTQFEKVYNDTHIPRFENNFWELVNLNEIHKIDWSQLEFVILYKYSSDKEEYIPFLIHSKLINSEYHHFYFNAVRYKGEWFIEDKIEITKDDKYAPKN